VQSTNLESPEKSLVLGNESGISYFIFSKQNLIGLVMGNETIYWDGLTASS